MQLGKTLSAQLAQTAPDVVDVHVPIPGATCRLVFDASYILGVNLPGSGSVMRLRCVMAVIPGKPWATICERFGLKVAHGLSWEC